jgi:hypothetical protein
MIPTKNSAPPGDASPAVEQAQPASGLGGGTVDASAAGAAPPEPVLVEASTPWPPAPVDSPAPA